MAQFHIDEVCQKGSVYPIVVSFQNVYVTEKFNSQNCLLLEDKKTGIKNVLSELCDTIYTGREENEDLGKTFILARNKTTGKVRFIEVGDIELKPVVKSNLNTTEVMDTKYLELNRQIGSKKLKQVMEQHDKLKFNVETVTEQKQNLMDSISEDQLDLSSNNQIDSDEFYTPAINREATKVEEVYVIDPILTPEQFEKIYFEIECTEYASNLNPFLKSIANKTLSQKHTVLLVYANTLLQLYGTLLKDIRKYNFTACQYSVTLNEIVMKNFIITRNRNRGRPPQYKDKCLCHALVFILLINNYKFNFDDLCQQLKLTHRTFTSKVALTGATLVTVGSKQVAELKLKTKDNIKSKTNCIKSISHGKESVCKAQVCNYKGINNNDMNRHSLSHSSLCIKEKPYKCHICQRDFNRKHGLKEHIITHTVEKPYKCHICQRDFKGKYGLRKHILTHTGEKPYKCDICQRCFSQSGTLKIHILKHTGEKPHTCNICHSRFNSASKLKTHIRTHTGVKPYKCNICQKRFSLKAGLKRHILTHMVEKPFKCNILLCQKSYQNKISLTAHISRHTGEKPYRCDICQNCFQQSSNLKSHIRTHTGEKPYKCDICQSRFPTKDSLKNHILAHSGVKPYECDICHSRFKRKYYLTTHISKHTGVLPYKCDICQKCFNRSSTLKRHILIHTGVKPHKCDICQRSFTRKTDLKRHFRTHSLHCGKTL